MAITSTQQAQILQYTAGILGVSAGGYMPILAQYVQDQPDQAMATHNLGLVLASCPAFKALGFGYSDAATDAQFVHAFLAGFLPATITAENVTAAENWMLGMMSNGATRAGVVVAAVEAVAAVADTDANWGAARSQLDNRTTVATTYTITNSGSSTDLATLAATVSSVTDDDATIDSASSGTTGGSTFTLTTGIDTLNGTSGNDTFQGLGADLGALDTINGGVGTDRLYLATTAATSTLSSAQISSIETLSISAATAGHTMTMTGLTGITTVENISSSVAVTIGVGASSLAAVGAVNVSNAGNNATTIVYQEAAVTGSADAVTLTVNNATAAGTINIDTQTNTSTVAGAIETVNLVSAGTVANSITLATNDAAGMGTLNISGSAAITVDMSTNVTTDVIVINAASATGKVTVSGIGAGNTFAGVATGHTITGGSANDTFVFGANYVGAEATVASGTRDVIDGGAGTDTVSMTVARVVAASTTAQANLTSIEALTISDAWTTGLALDISKFTDVATVTLNGATGTSTMTVKSGTAVTLAADTGDGTTTIAVAGIGVADSLTLNMAGFDFSGASADTFSGIETLNINTGTTISNAATFANTLTMSPSAGGGGGAIVVTGANAMTFTGVVTAASINASDLTGILTVSGTAANAITITGGSGADVINGSASADLITGGEGADTITGGNGLDSIVLTETTAAIDTVVTASAAANADTITGFDAGSAGIDVLDMSAPLGAAALTIGSQIAYTTTKATNIAAVTAACNTDAPVYWIANTAGGAGVMTLTEIETAMTAGSAAAGEAVIAIDNGTDTLVYFDLDVNADAGSGAGLILVATLVGITGASSLATGDFISA